MRRLMALAALATVLLSSHLAGQPAGLGVLAGDADSLIWAVVLAMPLIALLFK